LKNPDAVDSPPKWVTEVPLEGLTQINEELEQLNAEKAALDARISIHEKKRTELLDHYKLLYSTGKQLEDAVFKAFKALGFEEISKVREKNKETWVFKFQTLGRYEYGILQVKGSEDRIPHGQLTQCSKWTDEYFEANKKVSKAILVANQYRLQEYPGSVDKRRYFEPSELEYAKMKDICIVPSFLLFESVSLSLNGITKSRAYLEEKLAYTAGLLDRHT
jgi:hypothetical protein